MSAPRRVLLVEDNPTNQTLVRQLLEDAYLVEVAGDGSEAVERALRSVPDLILMDLAMPRLDGWGAFEQIRANPRTAHVAIVALTAHALAGDAERARRAGFDAHVSKPIDEEELLLIVRRLLERVSVRSPNAGTSSAPAPPSGEGVPLSDLEQLFVAALGASGARQVVRRHAASEGIAGPRCTAREALRILDAIGAAESTLSAVAHFAKVRWHLRRPG